MTFQPNPAQSLLIWRMLTGETEEIREPMWSKAKPSLSTAKRAELVRYGFVEKEKRGRANFMVLTDHAWAWAGQNVNVEFSQSAFAAEAMGGLLRRLIPFLKRNDLALGEMFVATTPDEAEGDDHGSSSGKSDAPATSPFAPSDTKAAILAAAGKLSGGRQVAVRLTSLRAQLPHIDRGDIDAALAQLQDEKSLALYRDDDTRALTAKDQAAALDLNGAPRHILYLKD